MDRRDFIKGALVGAAALALPQREGVRQYVVDVTGTVVVSQHVIDRDALRRASEKIAALMRWYNDHDRRLQYLLQDADFKAAGVVGLEVVRAV